MYILICCHFKNNDTYQFFDITTHQNMHNEKTFKRFAEFNLVIVIRLVTVGRKSSVGNMG